MKKKMIIPITLILLSTILTQNIEKELLIMKEKREEANNTHINQSDQGSTTDNKRHPVKINSNIIITGDLTANEVIVNELKATGNVIVEGESKAESVKVDKTNSNVVIVEKITPKDGTLTIEGNVVMTNELIGDQISIKGNYALNGVKQWQLIKHDDFESESTLKGWSDQRVNKCKKGANSHLGGHCNLSHDEVNKVFTGLPSHRQVRINALYHMLDKWNGETGYMKVNDVIYWSQEGHMKDKGIDLCGGNYNDPELNIPIDVIIDHLESEIKIAFGSTLKGDPCEQSFGIDDVMIYTK